MAELIQKETDLKFAREMVEYLHTILFTAKELQPLRLRIKELKDPVSKRNCSKKWKIGGIKIPVQKFSLRPNLYLVLKNIHSAPTNNGVCISLKESIELFTCLYKTWSHSQVATVGLVFLSGCYIHVLDLVKVISEQEVTMEFLLELDRFIQILESPIFSCKFCAFLH